MAKDQQNPFKVVTPKFRVSFPDLFEPKSFNDQPAKFSVQMLFDKKADLTALKKVANKAASEKWGDKVPKGLHMPFKDGNEKELDGYEDKIVVSAASKFKPQVVDQKLNVINDPEDLYAGCFARAAIVAYAWEQKDPKGKAVLKRGVSFNLESVQKMAEGDPFKKAIDPSDTFDALDSDDDDSTAGVDEDFDL